MKCAKGIWLRCGLLPYRLRGQQLALALLLRDKPRTAAQLAAALTEKGYSCDSQMLEKSLARLTKRGILSVSDGVYRCASPKLDAAPYTENQLLDLVGMTQSTVNGTVFYTAAPPASVRFPRPQRLLTFL